MLFPAANDLLTMFVGARGPLAAAVPAVPDWRVAAACCRQEAALKYFLLGAFSSALLPLRRRPALRLRRVDATSPRSSRRSPHDAGDSTRCCCRASACWLVGLLFKVGAVPFHAWTPDVYQGAPTAGHRRSWRPCTKVAAFGALLRLVLRRASAPTAGTGSPMIVGRRDPHHGRRRGAGDRPRPTSSGCWPTPRSRTPASSSSACSPFSRRPAASAGVLFYLARLRLR